MRSPMVSGGVLSAIQCSRRGGDRERVTIANVELRVGDKHAVGQELTKLCLRPSVHDAVNDLVQIRARVDVMRDTGGDIDRMSAVRSPPSSSQVNNQLRRPRTRRRNSRSRRLFVVSMFPSSRKSSRRFHCRSR